MRDLRTAAQQALEALEGYRREIGCQQPCDAERVLEAALEQPDPTNQCGETCERAKLCAICAREIEQEQHDTDCHAQGVCQRSGYSIGERKPLTEDEIERLIQTYSGYCQDDFVSVARAIERAHGIKGGNE